MCVNAEGLLHLELQFFWPFISPTDPPCHPPCLAKNAWKHLDVFPPPPPPFPFPAKPVIGKPPPGAPIRQTGNPPPSRTPNRPRKPSHRNPYNQLVLQIEKLLSLLDGTRTNDLSLAERG